MSTSVALPEQFAASHVLATTSSSELKIKISFGDIRRAETAFVRVFINTPDATADTPLDHPGYVRSLGVLPSHGSTNQIGDYSSETSDYVVSIRPELILNAFTNPATFTNIEVTCVAVPRQQNAATNSAAFQILGIEVIDK